MRVFVVFLISVSVSACGSSVEVEPSAFNGDPDTGNTPDMSDSLDVSSSDMEWQSADTGTIADVAATDIGTRPDMPPIVQPEYKVLDAMLETCSTGSVKGLSLQLIEQMNCLDPGVMTSFSGATNIDYSPVVFPFQQGPATETLTTVAAGGGSVMSINSALRTLPQQYLLYQWYTRADRRAECNANLAATPGRSNHNGGLAVDISSSDTWRSSMRAADYIDNVSGEPWHFFYQGPGGKDVRDLSVLAFQQLWNLNYPDDTIAEDGLYGPQTEGAIERSPAEGFAVPPTCNAVMSFVAWPFDVPLEVAERDSEMVVLVPSGIEYVEIVSNGEVVEGLTRASRFRFGRGALAGDYRVVAYDGDGRVRGRARGYRSGEVHIRPLGANNYAVHGAAQIENARVELELMDGTYISVIPEQTRIVIAETILEL